MSAVRHIKSVSQLPANLLSSALYYVRVGSGFDIVLTNSSGAAVTLNTSEEFLHTPDEFTAHDVFFYAGWIDVGGSWLIYRTDRLTSVRQVATIDSNAAHADLAAAWESRLTLVYV